MNNFNEEKLPEGWKLKCLKEIGQVFSGSSAPQNEKFFLNGNIPFIRTSDLSVKKRTDSLLESRDRINSKYQNELNLTLAKKGTVLFPKSGAAIIGNNRAMLSIDAFIVSHLGAFYSDNPIINKFIYLFMLTVDLVDYCENPSYPSLKLTRVKDITIPIPPLKEQERIVAKIDTLFAKIDKAISLTEESLKQAKNLLPSVLKEVFEKFESEIKQQKLKDVCELITDGSHYSPKKVDEGYPYVTVRDVSWNGDIDLMGCANISKDDFQDLKRANCSPMNGDILYSKDGTVGKIALVNEEKEFVVLSSLAIIRPTSMIKPKFLMYSMISPKFYDFALSSKTGAAIKRIVLKTIKEFEVSIPDLESQHSSIKFLDKVVYFSKQTQSKLEEQLAYLKQLKSSILSKAFKGEL